MDPIDDMSYGTMNMGEASIEVYDAAAPKEEYNPTFLQRIRDKASLCIAGGVAYALTRFASPAEAAGVDFYENDGVPDITNGTNLSWRVMYDNDAGDDTVGIELSNIYSTTTPVVDQKPFDWSEVISSTGENLYKIVLSQGFGFAIPDTDSTEVIYKTTIPSGHTVQTGDLDGIATMAGNPPETDTYTGPTGSSIPASEYEHIISSQGKGTPLPSEGTYTNPASTVVTSVMSGLSEQGSDLVDIVGGTSYVFNGWSMVGGADTNGQTSGTSTQVVFNATSDTELIWQWLGTNYLVETSVTNKDNGGGRIDPSVWVPAGSNVDIYAEGTESRDVFDHWAGSTDGWSFSEENGKQKASKNINFAEYLEAVFDKMKGSLFLFK